MRACAIISASSSSLLPSERAAPNRPLTNCSTLSATDWKSNRVSGVIGSGGFSLNS
ncbi:hypothetical protein D3C72_2579020 [compost metagenome]